MVEAFVRSVRCGFRGVGTVSRVFATLNIFGNESFFRKNAKMPVNRCGVNTLALPDKPRTTGGHAVDRTGQREARKDANP
jgi:hypothetical protein